MSFQLLLLFSFSASWIFSLSLFSFKAWSDSTKGQQGSEQEEGESCLMTEAGMFLTFPLQSFISPASFLPSKSLLTPSLIVELGWVGGSQRWQRGHHHWVDRRGGAGMWLRNGVATAVLFIERCGWVGVVGWGKKMKPTDRSLEALLHPPLCLSSVVENRVE